MTEQLKPCPLPDCGGEAEFESPVQCAVVRCKSCGIALAKELNPSLYTGYDALKRAEKRWVIDRWNTRPSASREIAVKPLKWVENSNREYWYTAYGLGAKYDIQEIELGKWWLSIDNKKRKIPFDYCKEAKAAANKHNERRILSAIDTTHGNTDPIAKYDDELRKVQGGWRDFWDWWSEDGCAIDTDPDVSWYDKRRDFAEIAFEAGRISAPTEHPTEQPSVRASEHGELCTSPIRSKNHKGEDVVSFDERHSLADIARWISENPVDRDEMVRLLTGGQMEQPSVRDVLSKAANDAIQGYAERTDRYASGFRNGIFTMRKSILRSLAQEGE